MESPNQSSSSSSSRGQNNFAVISASVLAVAAKVSTFAGLQVSRNVVQQPAQRFARRRVVAPVDLELIPTFFARAGAVAVAANKVLRLCGLQSERRRRQSNDNNKVARFDWRRRSLMACGCCLPTASGPLLAAGWSARARRRRTLLQRQRQPIMCLLGCQWMSERLMDAEISFGRVSALSRPLVSLLPANTERSAEPISVVDRRDDRCERTRGTRPNQTNDLLQTSQSAPAPAARQRVTQQPEERTPADCRERRSISWTRVGGAQLARHRAG